MGTPQETRVHLDPAASTQDSSAIHEHRLVTEDFLDQELEQEEPDEPAPRGREGLPPAFRMRHARHYVEQLMGDAPLRTVREIAVADIELPPVEDVDVRDLEHSIRQLGVLEPLLVSQHGRRYRVIAGLNRLRAARNVGLRTVPCLVHDVDEEMLKNMRQAATQRASVPPPELPVVEPPRNGTLPPAFGEVTQGLGFVSALLPAIGAAGDDRFRWAVLTDVAGVELTRARTVATIAGVLTSTPELNREESSGAQVVREALAALSTEARLRGIRLEASLPDEEYRLGLDRRLVSLALTGILQGMFSLVSGPGAVRVSMIGTQVRPALILAVSQAEMPISAETVRRFFDGEWREHPAGSAGALMLAGALRVARLHGGRVDVQQQPVEGCTITFVIPRPLADA